MIAYGREGGSSNALEDGYATKEADCQLGGFVFRQAALRTARKGKPLSQLSTQARETLALQIWNAHVKTYGTANTESYRHWLKRCKVYATHHKIALPAQSAWETDHAYYRRLKGWTDRHRASWPKLNPAVGTHLLFSPHPQVAQKLRLVGHDERAFLRSVMAETMKDFGDWRRKHLGQGHSLGWVAGSHIKEEGADGHPHMHLVVLKRDESGHEVDWSVSRLKGCKASVKSPDPIRAIKRLFAKNIQQTLERAVGKELAQEQVQARDMHPPLLPHRVSPFSRVAGWNRLVAGLKAMSPFTVPEADSPFSSYSPFSSLGARQLSIGSLIRLVATVSGPSRPVRTLTHIQEHPYEH